MAGVATAFLANRSACELGWGVMADKRTRACIFCGGTPVTKEHLVPRWVTGILKRDPRGFPRLMMIQRTTGSGRSHEWSGGDDINATAKCVCRQCNHGWMANLEESALPLLQKMMMGRIVRLDTHGQSLVAKWLALRALVFRYFAEPIAEPEREWLDYFYEHQLPPPTCYQWITAYNGQKTFHYAGNDITASVLRATTWRTSRSYGRRWNCLRRKRRHRGFTRTLGVWDN